MLFFLLPSHPSQLLSLHPRLFASYNPLKSPSPSHTFTVHLFFPTLLPPPSPSHPVRSEMFFSESFLYRRQSRDTISVRTAHNGLATRLTKHISPVSPILLAFKYLGRLLPSVSIAFLGYCRVDDKIGPTRDLRADGMSGGPFSPAPSVSFYLPPTFGSHALPMCLNCVVPCEALAAFARSPSATQRESRETPIADDQKDDRDQLLEEVAGQDWPPFGDVLKSGLINELTAPSSQRLSRVGAAWYGHYRRKTKLQAHTEEKGKGGSITKDGGKEIKKRQRRRHAQLLAPAPPAVVAPVPNAKRAGS